MGCGWHQGWLFAAGAGAGSSLDVAGNVLAGLGKAKELVDRFNEVSAKFAEEMTDDEMNEVIAEQAELQEAIDAIDGWDLERKAEIAMDALRVPSGDADVSKLSAAKSAAWPCVNCYSAHRICCFLTSRQTIWMRSRSRGCRSFWHDFPAPL